MSEKLPKLVVILGPTASGKTTLAIELAQKFNGEIISADSRQVYKKMNIGTAKPLGYWSDYADTAAFMVETIPHFMIDIVDPGEIFSLADFKTLALQYVDAILSRNKLPIIVGGTGLYIWSLVDNLSLPKISSNKKLRKSLEEKSLPELVELLNKLDPESVKHVDPSNARRVLRALEVVILSGKSFVLQKKKNEPLFSTLQLGIDLPREELYININNRVDEQIEQGLIQEVEGLMKQKYGWNLPSMNGIGYKQIGAYLRGEDTLEKAIELLKRDTRHYARRQLTWFRRDKRIKWFNTTIQKNEIEDKIKKFLN